MTLLDWSQRFLRSTRGRLVSRLRRGPATVEALAGEVGLSENGVRVHLATLERDGWISATGVQRAKGPGKPATLYALTPGAPTLLSAAYRPLLLALLGALGEREPAARRGRLLRRAGQRLARGFQTADAGGTAERALGILGALGGEARLERSRAGSFRLIGSGCPLADAVAVEPKVCQAVGSLLAGALDRRVVARCDRSGGPCCRFEVSSR